MANNPQNNYTELIYRVGTFFLLVGIGLVILFILSESAKQVVFSYFCWGTILLTVGFLFRAQYKRAAPPSSGRFSVLQRFKRKPKEDKAKK
jgi:hypothetical protein